MIIYQTYSSDDMAESDDFHPTFSEAVARVRELGAKGPVKLFNDRWCGPIGPAHSVYQAYIVAHHVRITPEGICSALKWIPNR